VTGHAARGGAKQGVMGKMAGDTTNDRAFDAAFGDADARRERNREG
jgi:hypothetical protein